MSTVTYVYPISRYGALETEVEAPYSEEESDVMAFYQKEIPADIQKLILEEHYANPEDDGWGYIKEGIIERDPSAGPVCFWEIMGDLKYYEGLEKLGENKYYVVLGS